MNCELRKLSCSVLRLRVLALLLVTVALGCGVSAFAGFRMRAYELNGVNRLALEDVARYYGMRYARRGKTVRLTSRYSRLEFELERRDIMLNGVAAHLGHAVAEVRGMPVLAESDFRKVLDPVLRKGSLPRRRVQRVLLDPGHGGRDPGCLGKTLVEKDVTLAVAQLTAAILRRHGFQVDLTRPDDRARDLEERVALARRLRADVFVSIHANAAGSSAVSGVETFILTPEGMPSTYSDRVNEKARSGNTFDKDNMRFGYELQKHAVRRSGADNRGVKHANFVVLRDAPCPAALIEIGFLTNRSEEFRLSGAAYRAQLALGIAQGILEYRQAVAPE